MLKREEDMLKDIPQQIADNAFDAVNELLSIERLSIAVYNEAAHRLEYASNPFGRSSREQTCVGRLDATLF